MSGEDINRAQSERATAEYARRLSNAIAEGLERDYVIGSADPCTERPSVFVPVVYAPPPPVITPAPVAKKSAEQLHWARRQAFREALLDRMHGRDRKPPIGRYDVTDLEDHTCHWPHGDGPFLYCGAPTAKGTPYCSRHCAVVFREPVAGRKVA